jgi:cytochrome c oxidase subunit 2
MPGTIPLFPAQASTLAPSVDNLYFGIVAITAFFAIVVSVAVLWFAFKYSTDDPTKVGERIQGSLSLEIGWTVIPFVIAMALFGWSSSVYFDIIRPPDQALEIYSVGKRWMWKFQHIGGQSEINELHVPIGRPVKITFTSEDVLHDLFIPAFRVKADAIPGRYSQIWFEATQTGEFRLFCAEYCGTNHSGMIGRVVVMEPAEYQDWLAGGGSDLPLEVRGEQLFQELACNTCHLGNGQGRGPSLNAVFGTQVALSNGSVVNIDESYIRESILRPQAKLVQGYGALMPTFQGLVSEESVMALIEYVKSLETPVVARAEPPGTPGDAAQLLSGNE